ncbi:transcriptional regulator SdiA [Erwinia sp. 9145]|uniref:transcriptional regulator SdiA n=1 Tax=Erwinia sp. 9145 TaxID=1500895 RepID=UPI000554B787|nr:transcriptional regulator SdiA [Erwinia sp. 9145]
MTAEDYFSWRNEMRFSFHHAQNGADVIYLIEQQIQMLGFEYYALYIRHPIPFTRPRIFIYSNYPKKWVRIYQKEKFAEKDPVIRHCLMPGKILLWNDDLVSEGQGVFEAAKKHGIHSGFSCSSMTKNRALCILSVASEKTFDNSGLTEEKQLKIQHLMVAMLEALQRVNDISVSVLDMELSQRELEILKWTAEGKTSVEISLILSISEHTVNFHQKNMQKRFNATNRTQVATYAAAIGLL